MKVVSFVPSLTETLIEAGIDVVGRTRFCIHPESARSIPIVGGTKDANWDKVRALKPDLLIFDREENTLEMARECSLPYLSTHVTSLETLASELQTLSRTLSCPALQEYSFRVQKFCSPKGSNIGLRTDRTRLLANNTFEPLTNIPEEIEQVVYLIWKNPWMAVSRETFIGDVCLKINVWLETFDVKYPEISLEDYDPKTTLLLFSSEPFPFRKHVDAIRMLGFPAALVDGESMSWFGIRSLRFLESLANE